MTFIKNLIFAGFLLFLLLIMMVYILTPNHSVIAFEIGKIFVIIFSHIQSGSKDYSFFFNSSCVSNIKFIILFRNI